MSEELIKLATKLGFKSRIYSVHENLKSPDGGDLEKLLYYLWLCELQKWFREVHKIHVYVDARGRPHIRDNKEKLLSEVVKDNKYSGFEYEEALEMGLYQALKLI